MNVNQVKMKNGQIVSKDDYIRAKTKDLQDWGYTNLTEDSVRAQVDKILSGDPALDIVGRFCQKDIEA